MNKKRQLLATALFALAATTGVYAYDFTSGGVYYNISKPGTVSVVSGAAG